MALGALRHSKAQVSVAVSGIAGPGGGSRQRPVGTVWMAWCLPGDSGPTLGAETAFIKTELGRWLSEAGAAATLREVRRAMEICVENANLSIFNAANANAAYAGMGTTLVMCVFRGERLWVGHIGDSRGYRLRGGELVQLTRDHSLLQDYLDAGLMTEEEAATSDLRNVVTRAMGVDTHVDLDVQEHAVQSGDVFLLCSDGLSDMVDDATIRELLLAEPDLARAADALVAAANARGGRDNIAVLLARASSA